MLFFPEDRRGLENKWEETRDIGKRLVYNVIKYVPYRLGQDKQLVTLIEILNTRTPSLLISF